MCWCTYYLTNDSVSSLDIVDIPYTLYSLHVYDILELMLINYQLFLSVKKNSKTEDLLNDVYNVLCRGKVQGKQWQFNF